MLDMSGKSNKNKAPKAKVPEDDKVPVEEFDDDFVEETAVVETSPASKGKGDAPANSKKKSKRGFKLSSVDPIILGSFAVFLAACLVVTGVTLYGIITGETSNETAEYGDTVLVDYTGSYFAYYDEDGAVIFDTSVKNVGTSDSYKKSYEFKEKDDYSSVSVTIGNGQYLSAFEDAIIGLKPGQEARVVITDGYGSLTEGVDKLTKPKSDGYSMPRVQTIPVSDYKTLFNVTEAVSQIDVESPYGWNVDVTVNSNETVTIDYGAHLTAGTYGEEGGVQIRATPNGANIDYEYIVDDFDENTKMFKTVFDGKIVYVISANGANMTYKTTSEKVGTTMYFVIKLVEFSS